MADFAAGETFLLPTGDQFSDFSQTVTIVISDAHNAFVMQTVDVTVEGDLLPRT